ncbi:MAG: hypothetical protein DHS20C15_24300 [Planctomycetota bacterium]|nr:MAG: hypothetical protein DHS20C15_24300 [Planctomycetota bacterium]
MAFLGDSDAASDGSRQFPQHQAALTILQDIAANPQHSKARWLDLGCGRGQILHHLSHNLDSESRAKIHYCGIDVNHLHVRETERVAQGLELAGQEVRVAELHDAVMMLKEPSRFDFITLTNTTHELAPRALASTLIASVCLLSESGRFFAYDMERLPTPELGAVAWRAEEIRRILECVCRSLDAPEFKAACSRWQHQSCTSWSIQLNKRYVATTNSPSEQMIENATAVALVTMASIIQAKLEEVQGILEAITLGHQGETLDEEEERSRLLYDYWSLSRALELVQ